VYLGALDKENQTISRVVVGQLVKTIGGEINTDREDNAHTQIHSYGLDV
jgi:hypothetical protein